MTGHVLRALGALVLASAAVLGGGSAVVGAPHASPDGPLGAPGRALSGAGDVRVSFISDACTRTVLRYGSKGQCVVQVQLTLNVLFDEGLRLDSSYGPATTAAVYRVQARYALPYDGICGPRTWAALQWALDRARNGLPY